MASIVGRAIIVTKTNKSGGALAKGDVVVVDGSNDNAVTTDTSGATTKTVGVVVEENGIANNASGRVQFGGHVGLVTVNASVTRGNYGKTHTVAKQATDAGASRVVGTFCVFTTGGTTPEADLFAQPDASAATGNVATDAIWDAAGDLPLGTGANTASRLAIGALGKVLRSTGSTAAWSDAGLGYAANAFPPTWPATDTWATTQALAAVSAGNGGALAVPIVVPAPMTMVRYLIVNNDTANARSCEFSLYYSAANGSATITQVTGSAATLSFTPTVQSQRAGTLTGGNISLLPGVYWAVIRNTSTTQTFGLGSTATLTASSASQELIHTGIAALTTTLDIVTSWTHTARIPSMILQGTLPDGTTLL